MDLASCCRVTSPLATAGQAGNRDDVAIPAEHLSSVEIAVQSAESAQKQRARGWVHASKFMLEQPPCS